MQQDITSNRYQLTGKIILQIILIGIVALMVDVTIFPIGNGAPNFWILLIFGTLFLLFNLVIFIQLLFLPIGVSIDDTLMKLEIRFLLLKSKVVSLDDIESYNSTVIATKSENYEGVLLHLKSGKNILLSNFNLKDYSPIKSFLSECKLNNIGKEKFSFFSYYTQSFI